MIDCPVERNGLGERSGEIGINRWKEEEWSRGVAEWRSGIVEEWWNDGGVEWWRSGVVEEWSGVQWWCDGGVQWWSGGEVGECSGGVVEW